MGCDKAVFESMKVGNLRAQEINSKNSKTKKQKTRLRPYRCEKCGEVHLTSMPKKIFEHKDNLKDPEYRTKVREEKFIRRESEYWEEYFKVEK